MSFDAIAQLLSGQRPYFLYCFTRGGVEYRFNASAKPMTKAVTGVLGTVWHGSSIRHPRVPNSSQSVRAEFRVTLPLSDPLAQILLAPVGINRTSLRIWKGFANDPDGETIVVYAGSLLNIQPRPGRAGSREDRTLELIFVQSQNELNRKGLIRVAQRPCTWIVYGRGCRLDVEDFKVAASVTAIAPDGMVLTVPAAEAADDNEYRAGLIMWQGQEEMILAHVGSQVRLASPMPGLVAAFAAGGAQAVDLAPGCDQTLTRCNERFNNDDNHGGLPKIGKTPFDGRSVV